MVQRGLQGQGVSLADAVHEAEEQHNDNSNDLMRIQVPPKPCCVQQGPAHKAHPAGALQVPNL